MKPCMRWLHCSVDGCDTAARSKGLCMKHYMRVRTNGTTELKNPPHYLSAEAEGMAVCSICGVVAVVQFKGRPQCAKRLEESGALERKRAYHREYNRHYKYGLPYGGIEELIAKAGGACEICGRGVTYKTAHVDHDHACCDGPRTCGGCVRGILCSGCNTALGQFGDDPALLRAAIAYLGERSVKPLAEAVSNEG